ncbi:MAG: hypothetical protein ACJ72W_27855 [Actinoallomurus sp.]
MPNIAFILAALACPLGMGAMMFFMMRPVAKRQQPQPGDVQQDQEIAQLREQVAQLRAEQQRRPASGPST